MFVYYKWKPQQAKMSAYWIFISFYDHYNDFLKFPNVSISSLPISWLILSRSTRGKDKIHTRHKRQHNCLVLFHGLVAAQDMIQTQQGPINGWISKACHFLKPMQILAHPKVSEYTGLCTTMYSTMYTLHINVDHLHIWAIYSDTNNMTKCTQNKGLLIN